MNKKRAERLKLKRAKRRQWLREQKKISAWARQNVAAVEYAVFSKPLGGKWQVEFTSRHEQCRDSAFAILLLRTDIDVRRVNV